MNSFSNTEKMSPDEMRLFQEMEFIKLVNYLNSRSRFYQDWFKKFNIRVEGLTTLDSLKEIPPVSKDEIQEFNDQFICVEKNQIADYCTTSGTLGHPVNIALTHNDLDRLAYNEYLSFICANGSAADTYLMMLTLDRQFMAGIAYYSGIRKLGAGTVRVGPGNPAIQVDAILRYQPTALIAVPSFIPKVIEYASQINLNLNQTSVKSVLCIGENIRNEDLSLNILGQRIVNQWKVDLYSTYASTEMQTAFTECVAGKGGHHHPDLLIFEILDENDNSLPPGQYGELTITTLGVEGTPLLRYKTGDICTYFDEPCSCGRTTARLSPVRGRRKQMIKYNGTTLYPFAIFNILDEISLIEEYFVEVRKTELDTDEIILYLSIHEKIQNVDDIIKNKLRSSLRVVPQILYTSKDQIHKMQSENSSRKTVKIIFKS